jgi:hypothetical protein
LDPKQQKLLEQKRKLLLARLRATTDFIRGSVVLMKRRCTRPGCSRCRSGTRHPTWVLTYSRKGKTRTVYLGQKRLAEARRMAAQYQALTDLVDQVARINLALLTDRAPANHREGQGDAGAERRRRRG